MPRSNAPGDAAISCPRSRTRTGTWASTQENLWSLVALAAYGRRGAIGESTATVRVGGKQVFRKKIVGAEVATVRVPLGETARCGASCDTVEVQVDNGAAISVRVREARVDAGKAVANGFAITRRYLDASGVEKTAFKAGEMVTVKLAVTADTSRKWIALVDPIPAGFEVINPRLAAGGQVTQAPTTSGDPWAQRRQRYWNTITWDHQELRDDRVQWFDDDMHQGSYELSYHARATIDGTFSVMPATIEAMYSPDVRGRTDRTTVTVTK